MLDKESKATGNEKRSDPDIYRWRDDSMFPFAYTRGNFAKLQ